jgi:hypothetical protein
MSGPVVHARDQPAHVASRSALAAGAVDALAVAIWCALAGLVGALVWRQVTTLPTLTRVAGAATFPPGEQLKQVAIDGWFFVVAAVGGLLSGVLLLHWRRRDPLLMVVLVALGGGVASWVMIHVGLALGPDDEIAALGAMAEGAQAPMQLELHAPGMAWMWSVFAVLGAIVQVWILRTSDREGS